VTFVHEVDACRDLKRQLKQQRNIKQKIKRATASQATKTATQNEETAFRQELSVSDTKD
jgi:hypothetical protein